MTVSEILNDVSENAEFSGGESGYKCEKASTVVVDETITVQNVDGQDFYWGFFPQDSSKEIGGDYLKVEFDNIEYELPKCDENEYGIVYGETVGDDNPIPRFDTFPLSIQLSPSTSQQPNVLATNIPGEHTIKIFAEQESITVTQDFAKAVKKAVNEPKYDYIIPETTMATMRYDFDLDDGDVAIINYCDITNIINTSSELWPIYITVNGETTTISDANDMNNYLDPTGFEYNNHSFALWDHDDESWMCFPEPGEYTFSMYTITEDSDSGGNSLQNIADAPAGAVVEGLIQGCNYSEIAEAYDFNVASGTFSHAEGGYIEYDSDNAEYITSPTKATGHSSHAEGAGTTASGNYSHAEGNSTAASGNYSHAEGNSTAASGNYSHAEGYSTRTEGDYSHAEGYSTIASRKSQHVIGEYNVKETGNADTRGDYVVIVGNGTSNNNRSNAFAIKWDGTFVFANGTEITPAQFQSLLALLS